MASGANQTEAEAASSAASVSFALTDLIEVSIPFEYDPDELATRIATQLVDKGKSKTYE